MEIDYYLRAASAAMCPANVAMNVPRPAMSDIEEKLPVFEEDRGDVNTQAAM